MYAERDSVLANPSVCLSVHHTLALYLNECTYRIATFWQGLKWGRVAGVGDPAPFDLPGL